MTSRRHDVTRGALGGFTVRDAAAAVRLDQARGGPARRRLVAAGAAAILAQFAIAGTLLALAALT